MKRGILIGAAAIAAGLAAAACDKRDALPEGAGESASTSATAVPAQRPRGDADIKAVCLKLCDRTVTCGGEMARELAKAMGGTEAAKRAAAEAEKSASEGLAECKQGCQTETVTDEDRGQIAQVERCLEERECGAFMTCMEKVSPSQ